MERKLALPIGMIVHNETEAAECGNASSVTILIISLCVHSADSEDRSLRRLVWNEFISVSLLFHLNKVEKMGLIK